MTKYIKSSILLLVVLPMMIMGCDTLFDKGDVEKSYDGPTQVAFFPLERQTRVVQGGTTVDVQLIGPQRDSAVQVNVAANASSTAQVGVHYNALPTSVTIPANASTVTIPITYIAGSVPAGGEVTILLDITGVNDSAIEIAENLKRSTIFIRP